MAPRTTAPRRPGKLRLSPTRLRLYLFCPKAYHYYYIRRLRWGEMTAANSFGGSLHRALQEFHAAGTLTPPSVDELIGSFRSRWSAAGYSDSAEAAEQLSAGEEILRQYFDTAPGAGHETVLVERQVKWEYPDFILSGKLDRLDRLAGGELEIIDYKSGRRTVTEEEVRGTLAMAVYQLIVSRLNPGTPVSATILCLPTGASATVRRTPEELDAIEQEIGAVAGRILSESRYAATPGPHCARCAFERICPAAWTREKHDDG
jgi:putative RecB family exonuclease